MTLLMTGGAGFLGLHLVREHLLAGRHVTVLARAGGVSAYGRIEHFLAVSGSIDRLPAPLHRLLAVVDVDITHHSLGLSPAEQRALAARATELWHVASSTVLSGADQNVWRANVGGTENVLRLAAYLPPGAPFRHISTAFVGGRRREGRFRERDSAEIAEFENTYERSKHTAEGLVRRWVNRHGRSALILRPSILIPGDPQATALPEHTLRAVGRIIASTVARAATPAQRRLVLRVDAHPKAYLNLVQVDWAARTMLRFSQRVGGPGTHTVHVVHPQDTPARTILRAFEDVLPVRLRMLPEEPDEPTRAEHAFYRSGAGFLPYLHHRRRFDDSALRSYGVAAQPPAPVERTFVSDLLAGDPAIVNPTVHSETDLREAA